MNPSDNAPSLAAHAQTKLAAPYAANSSLAIADRETAALHAQQAAENSLSMALYYLRGGNLNVAGARRKATQALAALQALHTLNVGVVSVPVSVVAGGAV